MTNNLFRPPNSALSRRALLASAASGMTIVAFAPMRIVSAAAAPTWWERIDSARNAVGTARPQESGIALDLPLLSEDGSSVALGINVDSPMTQAAHVREIRLFATRNPTPEIATLRLTPMLGRANLQIRVRLGESQTVGALAFMSDGTVRATARDVRITVSGCLAAADSTSGGEMTPRVRVPQRIAPATPVEVVTLITHPMETGLRPDAGGGMVPQRIIKSFAASIDDTPVLDVELFRSVAANPYLRFFIQPQRPGRMDFVWTEDSGRRAEASAPFTIG